MINNLYITFLILCLLAISVMTFITDFNHGKILNRHLKIFMKVGFIIQLLYSLYLIFYEKQIHFFSGYFINLFIGTFVSICLYYFDIWGAGDSKYVMLMLLISPVNIFMENDAIAIHGLMIFVITFAIAFIYLFGESLYFFIKEVPALKNKKAFNIDSAKEFIINWIVSYSFITIIYKSINLISRGFLVVNMMLVRFSIMLIMFYFLDKIRKKRIGILIVILAILSNILDYFINGYASSFIINYKILLFILAVIVIRNLCSRYNYKKIKTDSVKAGMILSAGTFVGFFNSRVKGLPKFQSESIRSKITSEEAESVRRWANSKYGQEYVYIVRQIPFAPFISLGAIGSILYFIF
ncbi:hypothetical protein [Clostridium diolis]|uniref:Prepilin peptidase n=1 Tax=Clostridium diolis TaxID=223919 RepID=A0AAV3VZ01_9CLOT|nr:hypothetical protein [Clostridium diolis]QES73929.1 hypothetical protein F3K33_14280 [Clostridium diolis]GEA31255.1 hypothetical protein CDIOL_21780 [Clostridium diolis]